MPKKLANIIFESNISISSLFVFLLFVIFHVSFLIYVQSIWLNFNSIMINFDSCYQYISQDSPFIKMPHLISNYC